MYATTYWPLRFSKYRMELDISFHSPTPTPSFYPGSPGTHNLFIPAPIWFPRSSQGHFQNRHLTASCSCSLLWDPTAQVKTQTWARPRGARPSVGTTLPRYTILSQFSGPQVLPHSQAFTCSSFCRSTLPPVPYLTGLLLM